MDKFVDSYSKFIAIRTHGLLSKLLQETCRYCNCKRESLEIERGKMDATKEVVDNVLKALE